MQHHPLFYLLVLTRSVHSHSHSVERLHDNAFNSTCMPGAILKVEKKNYTSQTKELKASRQEDKLKSTPKRLNKTQSTKLHNQLRLKYDKQNKIDMLEMERQDNNQQAVKPNLWYNALDNAIMEEKSVILTRSR